MMLQDLSELQIKAPAPAPTGTASQRSVSVENRDLPRANNTSAERYLKAAPRAAAGWYADYQATRR
jgi:hypothetical protein